MIVTVDTMYSYVDFQGDTLLREKVQDYMHHKLGVKKEGAFFSRAYKSGYWDGIIDFYDMKEDKFHTGLLPQFLEGLRELQQKDTSITYEVKDVRPKKRIEPEDIDEEIVLGNGDKDPIILRDYQYESVKRVFENRIGIVNVSTNGGKCVTKDSVVLTPEGYKTIEQIFRENNIRLDDKEDVIPIEYPLINRYGNIEHTSHFTKNGVKPIKKIITDKGVELRQTYNHPLLVVEGNNFVWKKTEDIKKGDLLVSRLGDNVFGTDSTIKSELEAYVLGIVIADGYLRQKSHISITNNQEEILDILKRYFESDGASVDIRSDNRGNGTKNMYVRGSEYVKKYHERYGLPYGVAKDKLIPSCVMQAPKNIQMAFISGFLECECSISPSKKNIEVTSASKKLLQQLQLLLWNIGVVTNLLEKKVRGYEDNYYGRLTVSSYKYVTRLLEGISFRTEERNNILKRLIDNHKKVTIVKTYRDVLPNGKVLINSYRDSMNLTGPERNKFKVPRTISRDRARKLIKQFPNGDPKLKNTIEKLLDENLFFQEVVSIEDDGVEPTFDVCMPQTHSFIASTIVNHNTEIAAGVIQQILPYLKRSERVAFFTHSKELFHQSANRIAKRLGIKENKIGKIGDGKFSIKNKQVVFVMVPTLNSALKDPKKGISFTHKERVIKFIAEEIAPKFKNTENTRQLLRNYIKNCNLTTKVWESALEHLQYIAYDKKFTDKSAQMQLNKYVVEFDKIMEKKNEKKYKKYKDTYEFLKSVKVMIADEVHRAKADTWYKNLSLCTNADYRIGLTGTVDKKDKMGWQRLQALFNRVIIKISNDYLISRGISSKPIIRLVPIVDPKNIELVKDYMEAYRLGIVENDVRNESIVKLALGYKKLKPGGILISVKEIEHGDRILEMLLYQGANAAFIHGDSDDDHRTGMLDKFSKGELDILIASTIIDEGVDINSIGCMVLAAGGKSMRQQLQRIGRGLRLNGIDGNKVMVFDFYDKTNPYLKKHSEERIKIFKEEEFDVKMLGQ